MSQLFTLTVNEYIRNLRGNPMDDKFWCRIGEFYKGVRFYVDYAPSRSYVIHGLTKSPVTDSRLDIKTDSGEIVPFVEYYRRKGISLQDTLNWPAVRGEGPTNP